MKVSILVVLDWVFKPNPLIAAIACHTSFNPCCIGLGIQTSDTSGSALKGKLFQSLLYWIGYSNDFIHPLTLGTNGVSILVVLDWVFKREAERGKLTLALAVSILVVLDWVFKPAWKKRYRLFQAISFNPCCIGLGIQTLHGNTGAQGRSRVSILVVLDWVFKHEAVEADYRAAVLFQSLLYWIGYSNRKKESIRAAKCGVSILVVLDWVFKHVRRRV